MQRRAPGAHYKRTVHNCGCIIHNTILCVFSLANHDALGNFERFNAVTCPVVCTIVKYLNTLPRVQCRLFGPYFKTRMGRSALQLDLCVIHISIIDEFTTERVGKHIFIIAIFYERMKKKKNYQQLFKGFTFFFFCA